MTVKEHERLRRLARVADAARTVLDGLKETPAGDACTFEGSTNDVDALRETLDDLDAHRIMGR